MEMTDKLKDVNTEVKEDQQPYYTDVFTPGETKEQLEVGQEVVGKITKTGTVDTSDSSLTTTDNTYTLSVDNPDGEIFSLTVDSQSRTFKIGSFGNTALAYSTLETELQDWLGGDYIVAYVSGTNFTISRLDKTELTISHPNLVRNIELTGFDSISVIDVIVDGVTVSLDGATHSGNATTAITYLKGQLSSSTYYMDDDGNDLIIARQDGAVPVITQTQYNKYTYVLTGDMNWETGNNSSTNLGGTGGSSPVKTYQLNATIDGTTFTYNYPTGLTWSLSSFNYTAVNLPGYGTKSRQNNYTHGEILLDYIYSNITGVTKGSVVDDGDGYSYSFSYHNASYSQLSFSKDLRYVLDSGLSIVSDNSSNVPISTAETNHLATTTVTTYTEINITLTNTGYNLFIPTQSYPKTIIINATSATGRSEGKWEVRVQSCTATYGTTTEFVSDKIFKTDANNYGSLTRVKRGGFIISWTTNTSNKLNYTCIS